MAGIQWKMRDDRVDDGEVECEVQAKTIKIKGRVNLNIKDLHENERASANLGGRWGFTIDHPDMNAPLELNGFKDAGEARAECQTKIEGMVAAINAA